MKMLLEKQVLKGRDKQNEDEEGSGLESIKSYFTELNNDRGQVESDGKVMVMEITERKWPVL